MSIESDARATMPAQPTMSIEIIYADGRPTEKREILKLNAIKTISAIIGANTLDTVNLRDGRVMLVDDTGFLDAKPVNPEATRMYHGICRPGTTHPICGDVVIAIDEDFA